MLSPEKSPSITVDTCQYFRSNPDPHHVLEMFVLFSPAADIPYRIVKPLSQTVLPESYFSAVDPNKLYREIKIALPYAPFLEPLIDSEAGKLSKTGEDALGKLRQQTDSERDGVATRANNYLTGKGIGALVEANIAIGRAVAKRFDEINPQLNPNQS